MGVEKAISFRQKNSIPDIVVIIPTYNNEKTLLSVIEGVKKYSNDIIVVNDGSTDSTSQLLDEIPNIKVLTHSVNKGKGKALKTGLREAVKMGFHYALTIDSDGQHYPEDIPVFVENIKKEEDALLIGARSFETDNMPGKNSFANKFSNFWFRVETGIKLEDTQSGYRLYPLNRIGSLKYYTSKYEFELAIIVFTAWKNIPVKNVPIRVYYPPKKERISHFRPFKDFTRITLLNIVLVTIALLWFWPFKFFRGLTRENIRNFINKEIKESKESNKKIIFSVMLGIFTGIIPIWGYQMIVTVFLAHFMKLNKVISLIASNISIPPVMPMLLYGSYLTGCYVTDNRVDFTLSDISLDNLQSVLRQYIVGSIIFAAFCSLVIGSITGCLLMIFGRNRKKES